MRGGPATAIDRRELRNFQRYLKLLPKYKLRMLQRPRWQKYLGLTDREAWLVAKAGGPVSEKRNVTDLPTAT